MKKTITTILCTAIFAVLAVSCQESIDSENPVEPTNSTERGNETIDIRVNGLMGEYSQVDATRSVLVNNVRVAWAAGDVVYVFDGSKYLGKLTAALDKKADGTDEDRYAKLGGTISAPATTPCVLSLVHSSLMTEPETGAAVSELSIDMSAQSTATVPFVAYATLKYTGTTITDVVVPFQFATSVIKVNCTGLKPGTAIDKATLSNVNTECKLTLSGSAAPTVSGDVNGTITRTGDAYFGKVNSEGEAVFQIAVPELGTASSARFLTVFQGSDKVTDRKFTTSSLNPATSVNTVCQFGIHNVKDAFSVSDGKQVYFSKGNLWADSNKALHFEDAQWKSTPSFNAQNPQEEDNMDSNHVSHFTWANTVEKAISKYDSSQDYLFCDEDHKQSVDGSANIYYALSKEEWNYLLKERTMLNGKERYSVATNSPVIIEKEIYYGLFLYPDNYAGDIVSSSMTWNVINVAGIVFLPAAGRRMGDKVKFDLSTSTSFFDLRGGYWTSSSYFSDDLFHFCALCIESDWAKTNDNKSPGLGCSLRLVRDAQ